MRLISLNGDQALAYGAMTGGVKLVTSYPGSPSSGTVETLVGLAKMHGMYVEWSSNEKVAMEMGIGASMAGRRALVCTKSVGMNVMIDPLMALNLTPVHGGLVILLGDDPGGYGSQNDQDTRLIASFLEMPLIEPSTPSEAFQMMREAFAVSEEYKTAVIIRETRSFSQQEESVSVPDEGYSEVNHGLVREPWRFVPVPQNAVEKHRELHSRMKALARWAEGVPFNRATGSGEKGIISAGFAYRKLLDVMGDEPLEGIRLLKLGVLNPLPEDLISRFLHECGDVLIVEESEPYVESSVKAIAHENRCQTRIFGKKSSHLSREGELFRWQIQEALSMFIPEFEPVRIYAKEREKEERPKKENFCASCGYDEIIDELERAAERLHQKPVLIGDPGCLVTVADRLDGKFALGSSVGVADGMAKAGITERAVALFGDSSFFHTTLPAVCNAVHNRSTILMVLFDNRATASSGYQPHPGVGRDALGEEAPGLDIERIARACGVMNIYRASAHGSDSSLKEVFQKALSNRELTLVIVSLGDAP